MTAQHDRTPPWELFDPFAASDSDDDADIFIDLTESDDAAPDEDTSAPSPSDRSGPLVTPTVAPASDFTRYGRRYRAQHGGVS